MHLVANFPAYATPNIAKTILTLGKVLNPHELFEATPVLILGEGSTIDLLKTWGNPGKPISGMSAKSLTSQQDRAQIYNLPNAPRFAEGKVTPKQTIAEFRGVGLGNSRIY